MAVRLSPRLCPRAARTAVVVPILIGAIAFAYASALGMGYLYDDYRVITGDLRAQSWSAWWADVPTGIRPLLKLSFLLNHRSGFGEAGFLAANLLMHVANTLLLWRIGLRLIPQLRPDLAVIAVPASALAALLFALHPVQAEAVSYFSGRSMPLMSCFLLAATLAWLRHPGDARTDLAGLAAFVLALLSRETAVVLPALLGCVLWFSPPTSRCAWRLPIAMTAVSIVGLLLVLAGHPGYRAFFDGAFAHGDAWSQPAEALRGLHYLLLRLAGLQPGSIDPVLAADAPRWLPMLMLLALAWAFAKDLRRPDGSRRNGLLLFCLSWFIVNLLPMYSLVPRAEPANDRHLYLAAWGLFLLVSVALCQLAVRGIAGRYLAAGLALVLLFASGVATSHRNHILASDLATWQEVIRQAPLHARGWHNLGIALHGRGRTEDAFAAYCRALELQENTRSRRAIRQLSGTGPARTCPSQLK